MNYIELINQFWLLDEEHSFSGNETRLYFFILKKSNSLRWKNPFSNADAHTATVVGVSINTLKSIRNKLKQVGLIDFKTGGSGARNKCEYTIKVSTIDTLIDTKTDTLSDETLTPYPRKTDDIYKPKQKGKDKPSSKEATGEGGVDSDLFQEAEKTEEGKPKGKYADIPVNFLQAYKAYYPGKKRSVETEFAHLKKTAKDYQQVIDMLPVAVENFKKQMATEKREMAKIKNMQGWITDRQFETYADATGLEELKNEVEKPVKRMVY